MIKFSTGNGAWMAVEIPTDAFDYCITGNYLSYMRDTATWGDWLPRGNTYTIIGIASELTEAQCMQVVEQCDKWDTPVFLDYDTGDTYCNHPCDSFTSLLRAHNIPPHYLILKVD